MALNILCLAFAYLFYFGHLGVLVPFLGIFLDGRGLRSEEIGQLMAIITLARIIAPNLWATLADKTGKGLLILRIGSFLTFASFTMLFWVDGFWGITLSFALNMAFWTAIVPQMESISLNEVRGDATKYSYIRLWGSVGFILLSVLTGILIDLYDFNIVVVISSIVLFCLLGTTMLLRDSPHQEVNEDVDSSIWSKIKGRPFLVFIASAILLQMSFGPYYGFFALYMRDLGYNGQETGWLVSLGVGVEVVVFLIAGRLLNRTGVKYALIFCMFATALRWYLLAEMASSPPWLLFSQSLHAFSFGLAHAASMQFIHGYFGKMYQSRGQALYASISFGVGGAAGNYIAGQMWHQGEGYYETFIFAAITSFVGMLVLMLLRSKAFQPEKSA